MTQSARPVCGLPRRAVFDLLATLPVAFRQVWAHAALSIAGGGVVDDLRIGQIQRSVRRPEFR